MTTNETTITTGAALQTAIAKHLNLPENKCQQGMVLGHGFDELLTVTVTIALTPADIEAIGKIMGESAQVVIKHAKVAIPVLDSQTAEQAVADFRPKDARPTHARRAHGAAPAHAPVQPMGDSIEKAKP